MSDVTASRDTKVCEFDGCGRAFQAKRSDARFCSATCRQRDKRARDSASLAGTQTGSGAATRLGRLVETIDTTRGTLVYVDIEKAIASADGDRLKQWDTDLTAAIQALGRVRRSIRDERQRHG
jgi:hypothetical protein